MSVSIYKISCDKPPGVLAGIDSDEAQELLDLGYEANGNLMRYFGEDEIDNLKEWAKHGDNRKKEIANAILKAIEEDGDIELVFCF